MQNAEPSPKVSGTAFLRVRHRPNGSSDCNLTCVYVCLQLPKLLELVGLGYSAWFTYRYLLFKVRRDVLYASFGLLPLLPVQLQHVQQLLAEPLGRLAAAAAIRCSGGGTGSPEVDARLHDCGMLGPGTSVPTKLSGLLASVSSCFHACSRAGRS